MDTNLETRGFLDDFLLRSRRLAVLDDGGDWGVRHFEEVGAVNVSLMNLGMNLMNRFLRVKLGG